MKKKFITFLALSALLGSQVVTISLIKDSFSINNTKADECFLSQYKVGETVSIPDRQIYVDEVGYDSQKVVLTPDGKALTLDSIKLDKLGVYTVEYRAFINNRLYVESETFETYNDLFTVTGNGTATYGAESTYGTGIEGLNVTLHDGEEIRFNEIVDLRKFNFDTPFIDLFATPNTLGERDVHAFTIRLTDAYDSSNYVTIDAKSVNSDGGSNLWWMNFIFVAAGPAGNSLKGIEWGKNLVHTDNSFGFPIFYSLYGTTDGNNSVGTNFFQLCYDLTENKIYGPNGKTDNYAIDLDDPIYFPNGWKGFTTGEVFLSLSGKSYYAPSFNLTINKVGNCDFTKDKLLNDSKPVIVVDCDEVPLAGLNNPYPVFDATGYDGYSGILNVSKKVFFNYYGDNRYELSITDNKFVPTAKGTYTIEYSAIDGAGNQTYKTISIYCDGEDRTLSLSLDSIPESGKTGLTVELAKPCVIGGIGEVNISTSVMYENKTIFNNVDEFTPKNPGVYVIKVEAKDIAGQIVSKEYSVEITKNDKPVIPQAYLPEYMISGSTYNIPTLVAFDESTNENINCDIKVNNSSVENNLFTVPFEIENVEIKYVAKDVLKTYKIPVIDYDGPSSLFLGNIEASDSISGVNLSNGDFKFANDLSSSFSFTATVSDNSSLNLVLKDTKNEKINKEISLGSGKHTVSFNTSNETISIDGRQAYKVSFSNSIRLSGSIKGSALVENINGTSMRLGASKNNGIFSTNGKYSLNISCGEKFKVLEAKTFYVLKADDTCRVSLIAPNGDSLLDNVLANTSHEIDITMEGIYVLKYVSGDKEYVYSVNAIDKIKPTIAVIGTLSETAKVGEDFLVYDASGVDSKGKAIAVDIFVIAPSGMIRSINQVYETTVEGGYKVRFNEVGTHTIRYMTVDDRGNYSSIDFKVTVNA